MNEKLKQILIDYAKQCEPHEMCGFVVFDGQEKIFIACENMAEDKENHFEISADDFLKASEYDGIVALVHSHPQGEPLLSTMDRQTQMFSNLDFWLVCHDEVHVFPIIPPLIGRDFIHGKTDCYTLFRDFYRLAGIDFPDFERDDFWWEDGQNLYLDNMEKHGFERVFDEKGVQVGDVILMQVGADVPNHAAIYIGNQQVLHHSPKRLSKRDLYDGYWLKHTHSIWRFKEWSTLNFTAVLDSLELHSS
ncbi:C40 family peptidase [Pasteurella multocida]|uniref:C40 family peptidase n=1 Tax=Pasteurella multocida TaxID=747 RepID=UPI002020652A|nr:C40 family peptidase [Pasteurella multocida]MCL7790063.1 C40 family peptidase [Pasteurella multocida]URH78008.1 C40 family peptidase [Pasteurella multocida]HDR1302122.1 C40 family peptidase [Pasteurella multocida]